MAEVGDDGALGADARGEEVEEDVDEEEGVDGHVEGVEGSIWGGFGKGDGEGDREGAVEEDTHAHPVPHLQFAAPAVSGCWSVVGYVRLTFFGLQSGSMGM